MAQNSIFDMTPSQLKRFERGERLPIPAEKFNAPIEAIESMYRGVAAPRQVVRGFPKAALFLGDIRIAGVSSVHVLGGRVGISVFRRQLDDPRSTTAQLPYLLTSLPSRDGITYSNYGADGQTRTAHIGGDAEDQRIVPRYIEGDRLVVIIIRKEVNPAGPFDDWLDLNVDARGWLKAYA